MNKSVALLTAALLIAAGPALAQDKAKAAQRLQNTLLENDKVRVYESISKPGEVSGSAVRPYRLVRVLQGGTSFRTYDDGKTQTVEYKTGDVFSVGPDKPYAAKNIGKTTIVLYVVNPKQATGTAKVALTEKKPQASKAEPGKANLQVLFENDALRAYEVRFKPGDESANIERPYRIVRALQGGTIQRTYPDGKTEKREWKTGEVRAEGPDKKFSGKNVGKTEIVLYGVEPKQAKK